MDKVYDSVIIGAGPAGITAAIYLKRANKEVLILERNAPGGQMNQTGTIENYPGVGTLDGPSLAMNMFQQILDLKIEYKYGDVNLISDEGEYKKVTTDKDSYLAKTVIVATGRVPKKLGLPNETTLSGRGVSWCAICDANLYKGKDVVVIGGGNSALEESLYLANIVESVTIVHRRDEFRGDAILVDKVLKNEKIKVMYNFEAKAFNEKDGKIDTVTLENNKTGEKIDVLTSCVFIFIGFEPSTGFLSNYSITDEIGYVKTDEDMKSEDDKIYAIGDIRQKNFFQIANAVGDGAVAAGAIIHALKE